MAMHRLTAFQFIPQPIDEVFGFFADPRNLGRITPPSMGFRFLTNDFAMRQGLEIEYRLTPLFSIPVHWKSLIDRFEAPYSFRDVQVEGPYRRWAHSHEFREADGGTWVEDQVDYELPFSPLGELGHWLIKGELTRIFQYRAQTMRSVFAVARPNDAPLTVAVAGGTGFVGGAIAQELFERGHRVVVLSRRGETNRGPLPNAVEIRQADATSGDRRALAAALKGVDALVVSLAFHNSPIEAPSRGQTFEAVDAAGTERLVAAAKAAGVKRLVYMSGAGAAPDAEKHWFRAKWRAETAVRGSGIAFTIIRPTWVYGPADVSLNRFIDFARRLQVIPMTNFGTQRLAPVFVDDVAALAADALTADAAVDQTFELGGPDEFTMREVIAHAIAAAGLRRPIVPAPAPLLKLLVAPLALLPRPIMTPEAIDFINQPATVDVKPLLARMPRRLTRLDDGLRSYLAAGPGELSFDVHEGEHTAAKSRRRGDLATRRS
jgi:NADH dehydrogenase